MLVALYVLAVGLGVIVVEVSLAGVVGPVVSLATIRHYRRSRKNGEQNIPAVFLATVIVLILALVAAGWTLGRAGKRRNEAKAKDYGQADEIELHNDDSDEVSSSDALSAWEVN